MGTRGASGFRIGGVDKVTYNHWDSYPQGLGTYVLGFVRGCGMDKLREIAERIELVEDDDEPTPDQVDECTRRGLLDLTVGDQSEKSWYCLLRGAQRGLSAWGDGLRWMFDSHAFLRDSLSCEWAYIINLDSGKLEVYRGFNQDPKAPGRYVKLTRRGGCGYVGVALLGEIVLDECGLMTDEEFIARVNTWLSLEDED